MSLRKIFTGVMAAAMLITAFQPISAKADDDDYFYNDDESDGNYWDDYTTIDYSQIGLAQSSVTLNADRGYDGYTSSGTIAFTGIPAGESISSDDISDITGSNPQMTFDEYEWYVNERNELEFDVYGTGTTQVSFTVGGVKQLSFTLTVNPKYDLSGVKLAKSSVTIVSSDSYGDYSAEVALSGIPSEALNDEDFYFDVTDVESSNSSMDVSADYSDGKISFSVYGSGETDVSFKFCDIPMSIHIRLIVISIKKSSYNLAVGKSLKIGVNGKNSGVKLKFKSLSPRVASVSSSGKVKAKRSGTAVIKVTVSGGDADSAIGTVVNVASRKKIKVFNWAKNYAAHNTYSMDSKRMSKGYFDCSSLVWRAYRSQGIRLVYKNYAPTAAELARGLIKKKVANANYTNFEKGKFQIGDLLFKTGSKNNRYKGIYHVEMFGGYSFDGFDSNGKAQLSPLYARINEGYGGLSTDFLCRP